MLLRAPKQLAKRAVPLAVALPILLVAGCGHKSATTVVPSPPSVAPVVPFNGHVTIYTVATNAQMPQADPNGLVAVPITVDAHAKDPAREAIDALITAPNSAIPSGTKLLNIDIDQTSGLATLDFSQEFKSNFTGGDTREAQVLNSLRETLGQFANVQTVQILVAGKKIDTLGGTEDLSEPLPIIKNNKDTASAG